MKKWCLEINHRVDEEDMDQLIKVIIGLDRNHFQYLEYGDYVFKYSGGEQFEMTLHAIRYLAENYWEVSFGGDTCEIKR
jgi:hypothetical protein